MPDRPIIFSGPMVRALLDGRKTQTRRVLKIPTKGEYIRSDMGGWAASTVGGKGTYLDPAMTIPAPEWPCVWNQTTGTTILAPYTAGDRLYVREAHALVPSSAYRCSPGVPYAVNDEDPYQACVYREGWERSQPGTGWRPSIHMPRWASRLTLTVTDVRVQRLQEISEADAVAEGVTRCAWAEAMAEDGRMEWHVPESTPGEYPGLTNAHPSPVGAFWELWNSLHGPEAWDANPWVVALTFTVQHGNIDQIGGGS